MSVPGGSYSEKDAQEILRRAAAAQTAGAMSREELVRAATELGISVEALDEAEKQYQSAREEEDLKVQYRAKKRHDFIDSFKVLIACLVIAYLMWPKGRDVALGHDFPWVAAVIGGYGVWSLIKHFYYAFFERSPGWQKGFEEFKAKDKKRKALTATRTNDKLIAEIVFSKGGSKAEVITNLRDSTGLQLGEATSAVEDYYQRHPEVHQTR